jgi:ribosome-binding factor A
VKEYSRLDRIADQMQRDLADLISNEVKDPRVGMATVNQVRVSKDLGYADVYVTLLTIDDVNENSATVIESVKALNRAAGFLRTELARRIKLRTIPALRFHYDASVRRGRDMDALIAKARQKDAALHQGASGAEASDAPEHEG